MLLSSVSILGRQAKAGWRANAAISVAALPFGAN